MDFDLNKMSINDLEIPDYLKVYLTRSCGVLTVESIANKTREELLKKYSFTEPQADTLLRAIGKTKLDHAKEEIAPPDLPKGNPRMDEIIKRVSERFNVPESSARSKVMSKGAQMVLTVLFEDSESIDAAAQEEMARRKSALDKQAENLADMQIEIEENTKALDERQAEFEKKKKEFDEIREEFEKAETAEARDRIRLLEVYNNIVGGDNKRIDYESYAKGAAAILSSANKF